MKYYLDTNILVFLWTGAQDDISHEVREFISDYGNLLLTSSVCTIEFMHLLQIGKVDKRHHHKKQEADVVGWLDSMGIKVVYTTEAHLRKYNALPIHSDEHRDPFDRFIIAQAIADHTALVSSDRKFRLYEGDGLQFVFNRR